MPLTVVTVSFYFLHRKREQNAKRNEFVFFSNEN